MVCRLTACPLLHQCLLTKLISPAFRVAGHGQLSAHPRLECGSIHRIEGLNI
jgi:hypothetical protein